MRMVTKRLMRAAQLWRVFGVKGITWALRNKVPFLEHRSFVEEILHHLLKRQGHVFIIQVGAHVGDTSNDPICRFIQKHSSPGQSGRTACNCVLVEPVRHLFEQLVANYKHYEGVVCDNVAIADENAIRDFYRLDDGVDLRASGMPEWLDQLGSLLPERMGQLWDQCEKDETYRQFVAEHAVVDKVQCITFDQLLDRHGITKVDFLQVDAEGYDYEIIRSINFERVKPLAINYERVHLQDKEAPCRRLLLKHDYLLYDHWQDTLCLQRSLRG